MCYDISFTTSIRKLSDYFPGIKFDPQVDMDFTSDHVQAQNYQPFPVVMKEGGDLIVKALEWGIISPSMKTPEKIKEGRAFMCNAMSEKLIDNKQAHWPKIKHNRCLVPVTGIFEHRHVKLGGKSTTTFPYHIGLKNRPLFCLPGLFDMTHPGGTFTVVTRAANSVMKLIHNGARGPRMPLFLNKELEDYWLQPDLSDSDLERVINFEMPAEELVHWPVYTVRSTDVRPDQKRKHEPYSWKRLPELGNDEPVQQISLF